MLCIVVAEIEWIEAAGNYVQIYCDRKVHLVRHTIKAMEDKLDPSRFVRVRPSAIVAVGHVRALNARPGGDYVVVLGDGTEIRSSRSYRAQVERALAEAPGTARERWASRRRRQASPPRTHAAPAAADPMAPERGPAEPSSICSAL